jgi:hypothetical protein
MQPLTLEVRSAILTKIEQLEGKLMRRLITTLGAFALFTLVTSSARAQTPGTLLSGTKDTSITFSSPVQLPNVTLPAGTYQFRTMPVANSVGLGDHVVQVSDKDGTHQFGMFITIPTDLIQAKDETVVTFGERPVGSPQALKVWFYPGSTIGEEFIYPKNQALDIARANHTTVLTAEGRVDENGQVTKSEKSEEHKGVGTSGTAAPAATDQKSGPDASPTTPPASTTAPGK